MAARMQGNGGWRDRSDRAQVRRTGLARLELTDIEADAVVEGLDAAIGSILFQKEPHKRAAAARARAKVAEARKAMPLSAAENEAKGRDR